MVHSVKVSNQGAVYFFKCPIPQCLRNKGGTCHHRDMVRHNVDSTEFTPNDYLCFRKDRNLDFYNEGTYSETARGGALLLIKRNLNPVLYPKGVVPAEVMWCKVFPTPKTEVLVGVVYRPELGDESNLVHICNSMDSIDMVNTILVVDFNF